MKRPLGLKKAPAAMQVRGAVLARMFTNGSPHGVAYYIIPGGHVEMETAEKIIARPDVISGSDGLFPGVEQTWRIVR